MKHLLLAAMLLPLTVAHAAANDLDDKPACQQLVALFMELAERSGEVVTEDEARAEVMSEDPGDAECAAMLALFPQQG
ncbi:MAG: hypothetical protein AAFO86_10230 [Pseudomonadota bacterium]